MMIFGVCFVLYFIKLSAGKGLQELVASLEYHDTTYILRLCDFRNSYFLPLVHYLSILSARKTASNRPYL